MSEEELTNIVGQFTYTIYQSDSYMVARFKSKDENLIVTGPYFEYDKSSDYLLSGYYFNHQKYGRQFNIVRIEKYLPDNADGIVSFLSSDAFPGIGKKTALKIYELLGENTLNILKNDFSSLEQINLTKKQLASLKQGIENINDPENEIIFDLISNGFSSLEAHKIFSHYKYETSDIITDNPFRFYIEIYGIGFDKVKNYAKKIDFYDKEVKYQEAFLIHFISDYCFKTGDLYIDYSYLKELFNNQQYLFDLDNIIDTAINHSYLFKEEERLYLINDYYDEIYIANFLNNFHDEEKIDKELISEYIKENENNIGITYDDCQKQAIFNFFNNELSIIIGTPGSGKTTIIKAMVDLYRKMYPYNNIIVVAPTGRAAKRINEICNVESKTIHSLLRWNLETNTFVYNIDNPILYDAIIIDEFSMVDNNLFASFLKACGRVSKLAIIGDENQLPSIRPGYLLNDLIESGKFIYTRLETNYRQKAGNEIITLANDIINDDVHFDRYKNNVIFINPDSDVDLISMINDDLNNGYSLDEIMVLSPMYRGLMGIDNLNIALQEAFNPKNINKHEKQFGKKIFRENDKILQLKNRPNDDVYNGDIGILEEIDDNEKSLIINYQGTYVFYNYEDVVDISLAYAMSVHKAQGCEYQIVYFIINQNNVNFLNKKLIYTAISRAKVKLVIICKYDLFVTGLSHKLSRRNTTLKKRLTDE